MNSQTNGNSGLISSQTLSELKLMLDAVSKARSEFNAYLELKFKEAVIAEQPSTPEAFNQLYKRVSSSAEAFEQYQRLINLYGCIGAQSDEYLTALENLKAS